MRPPANVAAAAAPGAAAAAAGGAVAGAAAAAAAADGQGDAGAQAGVANNVAAAVLPSAGGGPVRRGAPFMLRRSHGPAGSAATVYRTLWGSSTFETMHAARAIVDGDGASGSRVTAKLAQEIMRLRRARWSANGGRALMPYEGALMVHVPYLHGHVVLACTVEATAHAADRVNAGPDSWVIVDSYNSFGEENCRALFQWPGVLLQDPATAANPELAAYAWEIMAPGLYWTEWSTAFLASSTGTRGDGVEFPTVAAIRSAISRIRSGYEAMLLTTAAAMKDI